MHDIANLPVASYIGSHALSLYLASLTGLLCLCALCYSAAARPRLLDKSPLDKMSAYPGLRLTILHYACRPFSYAALVMLAGISGFCWLAWGLVNGKYVDAFDQALTAAIAAHASSSSLLMFSIITHLGDSLTFTLICIAMALILLIRRHYLLALGSIAAIGGNSLLNVTLKNLFERGRPLHEYGLMHAQGWSFPSGHSSGSVVVYGMVAYVLISLCMNRNKVHLVKSRAIGTSSGTLMAEHHESTRIQQDAQWYRLGLMLLAVSMAYTIGCSRIFLRVHYASDVLAGFMSGSVWLTVCISTMEYMRRIHLASSSKPSGLQQSCGSMPP